MEPVFNKSFFKFLFGFIFVIIFSLLGVALSNSYFEEGQSMFAKPSDVR